MTERPFEIPPWAPIAALVALLVWAVSIWWMVAHLDAGGDVRALEGGVDALHAEVALMAERVETLSAAVDTVEAERDALAARVHAVEGELQSAALVAAVAAEAAREANAEDSESLEHHPLYTGGRDLFNCRSFATFEEAQEALRVNGPGDPNHIDSNRNGIACEDVHLPSAATTSQGSGTTTQSVIAE
ncbi:MAG: hypothetical protein M0R73_11000 [Dehalococcoidia bacterium]|nr:hypothetical protein [Dehalococcoidia bacterium]